MREQNKHRLFRTLIIISLLLFLLDFWGKADFLHGWFLDLTGQERKKTVALLEEKNREGKENYEVEIAALKLKIIRCQEENKSARRLLGANLSPKLKFFPAHLLGLREDKFKIDVGSHQGVKKNAWVVSENVLVGKIIKTTPFTAEGIFVAGSDFQMAVGIWRVGENDMKSHLIAKGLLRSKPSLVVEEILPEEKVEKGDLVAGLGAEGQFLIGKVSDVGLDEGKVFKKATVEWFTNPRQLTNVFVVKQ